MSTVQLLAQVEQLQAILQGGVSLVLLVGIVLLGRYLLQREAAHIEATDKLKEAHTKAMDALTLFSALLRALLMTVNVNTTLIRGKTSIRRSISDTNTSAATDSANIREPAAMNTPMEAGERPGCASGESWRWNLSALIFFIILSKASPSKASTNLRSALSGTSLTSQ